jgi:hypothetical protein
LISAPRHCLLDLVGPFTEGEYYYEGFPADVVDEFGFPQCKNTI